MNRLKRPPTPPAPARTDCPPTPGQTPAHRDSGWLPHTTTAHADQPPTPREDPRPRGARDLILAFRFSWISSCPAPAAPMGGIGGIGGMPAFDLPASPDRRDGVGWTASTGGGNRRRNSYDRERKLHCHSVAEPRSASGLQKYLDLAGIIAIGIVSEQRAARHLEAQCGPSAAPARRIAAPVRFDVQPPQLDPDLRRMPHLRT